MWVSLGGRRIVCGGYLRLPNRLLTAFAVGELSVNLAVPNLRPLTLACVLAPASIFVYGGQSDKTAPQEPPMPAPPATSPVTASKSAPRHTNRLASETSPYLLQHAHNPVDWWPWGPAAFEAARAQDKPIFLSIGYSTCYWCHVMERESFENEDIAALMNANFICIKVDREERPDVDDIYMTATQLMTGSGGWPMSVFLEPQSLKPIVAGTYFPPEDRYGRPGFPRVLQQIAGALKSQRQAALQQADQVAAAVKDHFTQPAQAAALNEQHVTTATAQLMARYDRRDGGFAGAGGRGPKFPMPATLDFLIGAAWNDPSVRSAVLHTLDRMAIGGMYDQIGGGFHRYSTDEKWLVPHFEKMLYDNGQLASTYARAFELTGDEFYAEIVRETLDYVLREMTDAPGGGGGGGAFWSAQDAEVHAREGANFVWTASEVRDALHAAGLDDDVAFASKVYGLDRGPNFQDPHHPDEPPRNVIFLPDRPDALAPSMELTVDDVRARLDRVNAALLEVRNRRDQPGTDDKILTSWNGLMIAGMADGARVLHEPRFAESARRAATFILANMRTADGGLLRSHRAGEARIDAFLEDYALFIHGLLALHRATNEQEWLRHAEELAVVARARFWDAASGGYFDTLEGQSDLFVRVKSAHDGALPCGNSVMLLNLLDLHEATKNSTYLDEAMATLRSLSSVIAQQPTGPIVAMLGLKRIVEHYPERLAELSEAKVQASPPAPVQVELDAPEIRLARGKTVPVNLTLRIGKGYHINSHEPGMEFLVPLKVELIDGQGVQMTVEYPPGDDFRGAFAEGAIKVHAGEAIVPLRFEQVEPIASAPRIAVTWQACTDKACLAPVTTVLPVEIVPDV
jgi:uncharacterized protein YyaL (SSP411 family)